jgi:hypothetical protein
MLQHNDGICRHASEEVSCMYLAVLDETSPGIVNKKDFN